MIIEAEYGGDTNQYIRNVQTLVEGTFLEGISDIYLSNIDVIRFYTSIIQDYQRPDFFLGSDERLMLEGLDITDIDTHAERSDAVSKKRIFEFNIKFLDFLQDRIRENFENDMEYIDALVGLYHHINPQIDESKMRSVLESKYYDIRSGWEMEGTFIIPNIISDIKGLLKLWF